MFLIKDSVFSVAKEGRFVTIPAFHTSKAHGIMSALVRRVCAPHYSVVPCKPIARQRPRNKQLCNSCC
jgi:hypothetical protein